LGLGSQLKREQETEKEQEEGKVEVVVHHMKAAEVEEDLEVEPLVH
jgi:hypothetical protein